MKREVVHQMLWLILAMTVAQIVMRLVSKVL